MKNLLKALLVICPLPACAAPAAIANAAVTSGELLRIGIGLLLVIALIFFLSWLIKRLNQAGIGIHGPFKVIACASLGAREKIMLVKAGKRFLLLGVAQSSINTLYDYGETMPEEFANEGKNSFSEFFKQAMRKPKQ